MRSRPRSRSLVLAAVLVLLAVVPAGSAARAAPKSCWQKDIFTGALTYVCEKPGSKRPAEQAKDEGGGGGNDEPSCALTPPATYCVGERPCFIKDNVVPFVQPKSEPPKPDAEWVVRMCLAGGAWEGEAIWLDDALPVEPPLTVQAQEAVGQIEAPKLGLKTDPPVRSIVNLETRFTPAGDVEALEGTSAFGLVAIATPATWHVVTGDGTELACELPLTDPTGCAHTYRRSSVGQSGQDGAGQPAYAARSFATWAITYEDGGDPVEIPGAPATLTGPSTTTFLPVAEIQAVVTPPA